MFSTFRFCIKIVACSCNMSYKARESRMLDKMISKSLNQKKPNKIGNNILTQTFPSKPYECNFRQANLNKAYMERINDLILNGKNSRRLADLEIKVTKVRLSRGFNILNVYFITEKTDIPNTVLQETLNGALAEIQAQLGELRYLDRVPQIKFVRDAMLENAIKLERVFKILDFGKEYKPLHEKKVFTKNHFSKEDGLPEMRQNVLGVDVAKIKEKINAKIIRFKAINVEESESDPHFEHENPKKLMVFTKKDFFKFFKRRRIDLLKREKMLRRGTNAEDSRDEIAYDADEDEYEFEDEKYRSIDVDNDEDWMKDEKSL